MIPLLLGCGGGSPGKTDTGYQRMEGEAQGTTYHITYLDEEGRDHQRAIDSLLLVIDKSMSTYRDSSLISIFNTTDERAPADEHMVRVLWKSFEVYYNSQGAFDPTVEPLLEFWGFDTEEAKAVELVDSTMVDSITRFIGLENVALFEASSGEVQPYLSDRDFPKADYELLKAHPGIGLNFNAIAQGYSVDVICDWLERRVVRNYMVEIGGEVRVKGLNSKGELWRIGIDKPQQHDPSRPLQAVIKLRDKSIATSGNYRKFYIKDGVKYSHTINPVTGFPVQHSLLSATVLTEDCMSADAYATAFMVMGYHSTVQFLQQHGELQAYLVYVDDDGQFQTWSTDGIKDHIKEVD